MSTVVGASGAISAIITFVCLTYREYVIPIETPIWLKMFLPNDEIEVSFAVAGLLWFVNDIFGSVHWNRYFNDDESNMEKEKYIAYSSHVGGSLFGFLFFGVYFIWQRHGSFFCSFFSTVSIWGKTILSLMVPLHLIILFVGDVLACFSNLK